MTDRTAGYVADIGYIYGVTVSCRSSKSPGVSYFLNLGERVTGF